MWDIVYLKSFVIGFSYWVSLYQYANAKAFIVEIAERL